MVSIKEILKAINTLIELEFGITPTTMDISEGFTRNTFFVEHDNYTSSNLGEYKDKSMTMRIYYFPTDKYKNAVELIDVQERLENIFIGSLKVSDTFYIPINEVNADVVDKVLQFSFELYLVQEFVVDESDIENIEVLQIDINNE